MTDELTCRVIEIIRGTTHDGPGLRTTVFLKGCPLRCLWCQNPEGISSGQEVWWEARACIRCLACADACASGALQAEPDGLRRDRAKCAVCGACVEACPSRAMAFTGKEWSLDALVKEALKDKDYHRAFGGGVTASGGEPLSQYPFVAHFFRRLREEGVHTALDTCGLAPASALARVLPHTDLALFDLKFLDSGLHRRYTGQSNDIILHNLADIADFIREANGGCPSRKPEGERKPPMRLWIRTPLIPDTTATPDNIAAIGQFIRDRLSDVAERWELCAFNSACNHKYEKLGLSWAYETVGLMAQAEVDRLKTTALSTGIEGDRLVVSGLTRKGG